MYNQLTESMQNQLTEYMQNQLTEYMQDQLIEYMQNQLTEYMQNVAQQISQNQNYFKITDGHHFEIHFKAVKVFSFRGYTRIQDEHTFFEIACFISLLL